MDGIVNSLTSVVPLLQENNIIANRTGPNGPPVEVLPLPQNSFLSDQTTAEFLDNPYTLSFDMQGRHGELLDGLLLDDTAPGGAGEGAYKLSLGAPDDADVPPMVAFELSRAKSYEELGMLSPRRLLRSGRELATPMPVVDAGTEPLSQQPRMNPLVQVPVEAEAHAPPAAFGPLPFALLEDAGENIPPAISRAPVMLGESVSDSESIPQVPLKSTPPSIIVDGPEPNVAMTRLVDRLSVSDFQAVMELEPDLRDAFIRMISQDNEAAPRITLDVSYEPPKHDNRVPVREAPRNVTPASIPHPAEGQSTVPVLGTTEEPLVTPFALPMDIGDGALPPKLPPPPLILPPNAFPVRERTVMPDGTIIQQPPELIRYRAAMELPDLSAGVLATVAAMEYKPPKESKLSNLKKTAELPYSLYLFGPIQGRPREDEEEEEDPPARKTTASPLAVSGYLRRSEAVRMAAVLHDIYRGGNGDFEEATPWYLPYVRYAVAHDMIQNGEFEDYNEFATRAEAAYIFSSSVPAAEFPVLNAVGNLKDVDEYSGYGGYIYRLLRAGVLLPADQGFFYPEQIMTWAEAVALVGRIATPTDRKRF